MPDVYDRLESLNYRFLFGWIVLITAMVASVSVVPIGFFPLLPLVLLVPFCFRTKPRDESLTDTGDIDKEWEELMRNG